MNSLVFSLLRRLAWITLAVTMVAACGSDESESEPQTEETSAPDESAASDESEAPDETPAPDDTSATDGAEESINIAYIQTGPFDYYVRGVEGAEMAANELGVELTVLNSDNTPEQEIANVEDAIQLGVDGMIVFSVGQASLQAALEKADEAGIPVAVLYGYAPEIEQEGAVFIQAPVVVTGQLAGEWMADNVGSGKVAIIQGALGRGDAEAYTESFESALAANSNLEVVAQAEGNWDRAQAQTAMADVLTANPDLAAVFVHNEDMALGAIAAIDAAGLSGEVVVVAQNGSPDGLDAVADGEIAATVAWSPSQEAQMALVRLVDLVRDGTEADPRLCNTPTSVITSDNIDEAVPWVPTPESTTASLTAKCAS